MRTLRVWLTWAVVLALLIPVTEGAPNAAPGAQPQLPGSWLVTVSPDPSSGIPPFPSATSITRDGRLLNIHPGVGTSVGEWIRQPGGEYAVTFVGLIPANNTILRSKVRAVLEMDKSGDEFSGPFQTDIFDANGNPLQSFSGTVAGTRIGVDPL